MNLQGAYSVHRKADRVEEIRCFLDQFYVDLSPDDHTLNHIHAQKPASRDERKAADWSDKRVCLVSLGVNGVLIASIRKTFNDHRTTPKKPNLYAISVMYMNIHSPKTSSPNCNYSRSTCQRKAKQNEGLWKVTRNWNSSGQMKPWTDFPVIFNCVAWRNLRCACIKIPGKICMYRTQKGHCNVVL